jgi:polyribonucleotide nucleotidyltransferase
MVNRFEFDLNNLQEKYEFGKVAKQANGAVWYKIGDAVLLATVVIDETEISDADFLPLTVQYVEKAYAAAKFPGGFIKRETKPGDFETLTARIIDRSLRPLFPKGFTHPVVITVMVFSADLNVDLQVAALNAASSALFTSNLPINKSVTAVRLGKIDGDLIINPDNIQIQNSQLDLFIAGSKDELLMIEMRSIASNATSNAMPEDDLIKAIAKASDVLSLANTMYEEQFLTIAVDPLNITLKDSNIDQNLLELIQNNCTNKIKIIISNMAKSERNSELTSLAKQLTEDDNYTNFTENDILKALQKVKKDLLRSVVLNDKKRADGRGFKEVREINIETNVLPSAHSSCLFTRGQTQALVSLTIGGGQDAQMYEMVSDKKVHKKILWYIIISLAFQ